MPGNLFQELRKAAWRLPAWGERGLADDITAALDLTRDAVAALRGIHEPRSGKLHPVEVCASCAILARAEEAGVE